MKVVDKGCPAWCVTVRRPNGYFVYIFAGSLKMLSKLAKQNKLVNHEIVVAVELHNQDEVMRCMP